METMDTQYNHHSNKHSQQHQHPQQLPRRQSNIDEIPADVGKLRDNRKGRHNSLFVSPTSGISSASTDDFSRITSMTSDRSSIITSNSGGSSDQQIPDYETGNEENDGRLKKLHYAAVEFLKVQSNYVQYLKEMAVLYPEYMERFGKRMNRDLLAPHNGHENVVLQIKKIMVQILPIHEMLLKEIDTVCSNWDSRQPNMSKTIGTFADFLKCCQPFLDNKADFLTKLLQLRNEDKEFDEATYMFETEVFKRGKKGAVIQQLDQVHQNFMRYKLLMLRYSEYLLEGSEEKKRAEEAIAKLETVTQAVNQKMGLPTTEELTKLYYRFQCQFNVLEPGRVLIRQGEVMKQTRKEEQPRFLVLFTDCLWICRVSSSQQFEMNRSYRIPLEYMRFERMEADEYVRCLMVRSKVKSAVIIFGSEKERNQWADDLTKAQFDRKSYKRRQSTAVQKHDENKLKMKKLMMLSEKNSDEEIQRPSTINGSSRSTSGSHDEDTSSSVPVTPLDIGDAPFGDEEIPRNGSKKQTVADVIKPVWLPDNISNECLMEGCSTEFNLINRRHHCRDCGWLICKYCKGQAPLAKFEYSKQNVCSECYDRQFEIYKAGTLFPTRNIVIQSDGTHLVKIGKRDRQEVVDPRSLFKHPTNLGFRHRNVEQKRAGSIVFGRIFMRHRKSEQLRHALIRREDLKLVVYKAELDSKPILEVLIYGYLYRETQLDDGWLFELVHRNQIKTDDAKDEVIAFRVDNNTSAKKWSAALADKLEMDPTHRSTF
uniref:DH domain-containing protein n=1 Tax=Caenorhabditis tropicalis TaxID=1561998 RepID=A0A1I7UJ64_9PELO